MNRGLHKASIIIWSIVLVVAVGLFATCAVFFNNGGFNNMFNFNDNSNLVTVKEQTISDEVSNLELKWIDGPVSVLKSSDNDIHIVQKGKENLDESKLFRTEISGNMLRIIDGRSGIHLFGFLTLFDRISLDIYLPEKVYDKFTAVCTSSSFNAEGLTIRDLEISTVSGGIDVTSALKDAGSLRLNSTSGEITCSGEFESADISTTSGGIQVTGLNVSGDMNLNSTSGSLKASGMSAANLDAGTVSGSIRLDGAVSRANLYSTSGGVNLTTSLPLDALDVSTVSGGVHITMPENDGFKLKFSKVSGSFNTDFPTTQDGKTYQYKDGGKSYSISTTSGGCTISKG